MNGIEGVGERQCGRQRVSENKGVKEEAGRRELKRGEKDGRRVRRMEIGKKLCE